LGLPYQPTSRPRGSKAFLYNGGGQSTGEIWDPTKSRNVSIKLIGNQTNFTFPSGVTAPAWTVRFTGDPVAATKLLKPDANGCLGFTKEQSKDTPLLNLIYGDVPAFDAAAPRTLELAQRFTVSYTSRGKTYTLQRVKPGRWE